MSIQEFVRDVGKKVGPMGAAFMMSPSTGAAGETAGLDFMSYYVLGRGGVLGDVDGKTAADAFHFFNPELVASTWDKAKAGHDPKVIAKHYEQACAVWGREKLTDVDGLGEFTKMTERVAQNHEPTPSSALFAGWREMSLADDPAGRAAVQCALVLRELRGGAHIDAVKEVGVEAKNAVAGNSPYMYQLFGYTDEMPDAEPFKAKLEQAETITDESLAPAFSVLSDAERDRFGSILAAIATKAGV